MGADMVPKYTSEPFEQVLQAHLLDDTDITSSFIDHDPLDIYSLSHIPQPTYDEDPIYGHNSSFHTLLYDISSIDDHPIPVSTFVCTQSKDQPLLMTPLQGKVKKTWYKHLFESDLHVDPDYALDTPTFHTVQEIFSFPPTVIQASYLGTKNLHPFSGDSPFLSLSSQSLVIAQTPSNFSIPVLLDTGCHKNLLNKALYDAHPVIFSRYTHIPFHDKHAITVGNGDHIIATSAILLPLLIQEHIFQFFTLIVEMDPQFHFILGIESLIQLESTYTLATTTLTFPCRTVPLYPTTNISLPPQASTVLHLSGDIPCTFTSGAAIIHIFPLDKHLSFLTLSAIFTAQTTSFRITNTSSTIRTFPYDTPFAVLDLRSLGYYSPPSPIDTIVMGCRPLLYPTPFMITNYTSDNITRPPSPLTQPSSSDTQDPYPWLDTADPRRFQTDRQILESAIDLSQSSLTTTEKQQFYDLLEEFSDAFSLRDEIGLAPDMQVTLELKDTSPFFIRPFSVKEDMKTKIDREMARLVTLGILRKGLSGYSSPAMAIPRKNSDIPRVVADFRHLNTRLVQLNMTFPLVKDCIQTIGASQCEVMSVIDLRDAYHTLRLAPESRQYTGITPYYGSDTYLYYRLPMGLSVSPAIWQTYINKILGKIPNRIRYICIMDDCLVHSKNNTHFQDLRELFQSLRDNGLKISPRKCQFFRTSLVYMGFRFLIHNGRPSFTPMKDKCDAIRNLQPPKTVKDCRKFCGMVNFLATFLKDLQKHLIPIYNLTKKTVPFVWNSQCQKAFDTIKLLLIKPPILRMPAPQGLFRLMSDTSILATGGTLYQQQQNAFYIIGYNSKKLPSAASRYSITELELFGLVINIHAFRQLLDKVYFECFCDHSAITHILTSKKRIATRRLEKLIDHLLPFNFSVYYLPGEKMHITDVLSRLAGKDLDPPDQVIPISFLGLRPQRTRRPPQLVMYTADKCKPSQLPSGYVPSTTTRGPKAPLTTRSPAPLTNPIKPSKTHRSKDDTHRLPSKTTVPSRNNIPPAPRIPIPSIVHHPPIQTPPVISKPTTPTRKSLINTNLQVPQTLPPLDLPPPPQETLETFRPPDPPLYHKPMPILRDATELDVFTRHIPKQEDIDRFLRVLKAKVTKAYDIPLQAQELLKAYPTSPAFKDVYNYITVNHLPPTKRQQRIILTNAENYIVANGLLFRLHKTIRKNTSSYQTLLVIPEAFENVVFHMYHDSLLGAHLGPINTYYTIKDKYYIHNMFEKLNRYISACDNCQKQKAKRDKSRPFHPRIPLTYNPMAYLSADIKYMPKGIYNYEFLLVTVCEITGFVVAVPLVKHDAISIAHALLDRIVLVFGPPKSLIVDEDRALSSKVMHYVLDALKIQTKCISPYNHGSLKTERYIQTLNNLITRHLKDKGAEWPLYVTSTCYAMNTFVSTSTGFSPYELVFLKKPPDILNLYFHPLDTVAKGYRDYCTKMRAKLENVSQFILELRTFQQNQQAQQTAQANKCPDPLPQGRLVYLLAPSAASLQTNTLKCRADYVGPLVINKMLDATHYILNDLQGQVLCGVYHVNRLKKASLRTPTGTVTMFSDLRDTFNNALTEDPPQEPLPDIAPAAVFQSLYTLGAYRYTTITLCDCPLPICFCE